MKKIVTMLLLAMLCLSLTACGGKQTLTNEKGEVLKYSLKELSENGFYVHDKKEDTFTPLMSGSEDYQGVTLEYDPYRYIWFGSKEYDFESLIPKVDSERYEIILYQNNEGDMPESYVLEKYKKVGYTLGVKFGFGDTGNEMFMMPKETCASSMASDEISDADEYLPVYAINGDKKLPLQNIDTDINMILGLEKGKKYDVEYFDGTKLKDITLLADTVAFKSKQLLELSAPLKRTEKGYFIVKMPINLKAGYYYLNEAGLFKYAPSEKIKEKQKKAEEEAKKLQEATKPTEAKEEVKPTETTQPTTSTEKVTVVE